MSLWDPLLLTISSYIIHFPLTKDWTRQCRGRTSVWQNGGPHPPEWFDAAAVSPDALDTLRSGADQLPNRCPRSVADLGGGGLGGLNPPPPPPLGCQKKKLMCIVIEKRHHNMSRPTQYVPIALCLRLSLRQ